MTTILFLHGTGSTPGGGKPSYLAERGFEVLNPQLIDVDFEASVLIAQFEIDTHQPDVIVGSSRGGAVAMNVNARGARLVLVCPAWRYVGSARTVKPGTTILHSPQDEVVPFADSEELVLASGLPRASLIETGSDHRLSDPESLAMLARVCSGAV